LPFLKIGVTQASFQAVGKVEESSDLTNNMDNGILNFDKKSRCSQATPQLHYNSPLVSSAKNKSLLV